MLEEQRLDVRTITLGVSLLDCASADASEFNRRTYDKITRAAERLVSTADDISKTFGVPIVNVRISVTPIAIAAAGCLSGGADKDANSAVFIEIAHMLDRAAQAAGVNFIGGFAGLTEKGETAADAALIDALPEALATTSRVCGAVNLGTTKNGINMDCVKKTGEVIKRAAYLSRDTDSSACCKFVVFCNAVPDNPFMAGAFHGVGERDLVINVGVSGPGVVKRAVETARGADFETLCETVKRCAFKITRAGQLVAQEAAARLGIPFGIIDLSLAPTPAAGDSVAEILTEMGLLHVGAPGSTLALAILNDNIKKGGIMASSYVGGLSGAFIPVSEDAGMVAALEAGALTLEKLEAMTAVCSVGLDMVAIPGDTPASVISGIIADEMAIGFINNKTTAVRIIPVYGKKAGEQAVFGGLLGASPIMPVNTFSCENFINRGGRVPPPVHSFRN